MQGAHQRGGPREVGGQVGVPDVLAEVVAVQRLLLLGQREGRLREHVEVVDGALLGEGQLPLVGLEDLQRPREAAGRPDLRVVLHDEQVLARAVLAQHRRQQAGHRRSAPRRRGQRVDLVLHVAGHVTQGADELVGVELVDLLRRSVQGSGHLLEGRVERGDGRQVDPPVGVAQPVTLGLGQQGVRGLGGAVRGLLERARHHLDGLDVVADDRDLAERVPQDVVGVPARGVAAVLDLAQRLLHRVDVVAPHLGAELVRLVLGSAKSQHRADRLVAEDQDDQQEQSCGHTKEQTSPRRHSSHGRSFVRAAPRTLTSAGLTASGHDDDRTTRENQCRAATEEHALGPPVLGRSELVGAAAACVSGAALLTCGGEHLTRGRGVRVGLRRGREPQGDQRGREGHDQSGEYLVHAVFPPL